MSIDVNLIKELRDRTGAGMMDCKAALTHTDNDMEKAKEYLRQKGIVSAEKKSGRTTKEGIIDSYIHQGSKIGVMVEVNCETDFVARNEEFRTLVRDIAMQIAGADPIPVYINRDDVPSDVLEKEKAIYAVQVKEAGKEKFLDKIVKGKLETYYTKVCLMEQTFIKEPSISVKDYLKEKIAKIGENISIRRFVRFQLGEEL
ncbi:MAG: translation elongation factor Ts [Nitrospirota bacterium]